MRKLILVFTVCCFAISVVNGQVVTVDQEKANHEIPAEFQIQFKNSGNSQVILEISNDLVNWVKYRIQPNDNVYYEMKKRREGENVVPANSYLRLNSSSGSTYEIYSQRVYRFNKSGGYWSVKELVW